VVEPQQKLSVVQADDSDNRYIECAVASGANYIVTGDPHLLTVNEYQGIIMVSPATFLALLDAEV
jgi:predicted nucleic acid-binding protein